MGKNLLRTKLSLLLALLMIFSPVMPLVDGVKTVAAEEGFSIASGFSPAWGVDGTKWDDAPLRATVENFVELEEEITRLLYDWEDFFQIRFVGQVWEDYMDENYDTTDDDKEAAAAAFVAILTGDLSDIMKEIYYNNDYIYYNLAATLTHPAMNVGFTEASFGFEFNYRFLPVAEPDYTTKKAQESYVAGQVEDILDNLGITDNPGLSHHFIVKRVNDYVTSEVIYDTANPLEKFTAFDALFYGEAVCQGYALLTYKLLEESGVVVRIVEGDAFSDDLSFDPEGHAWNLVNIDGIWYHLDTTWNAVRGYDYYNQTESELYDHINGTRHEPNADKNYPVADTSYYDAVLALAESFVDDDELADFVDEDYLLNFENLIEVFPAGEGMDALTTLMNEARTKLEETDPLDVATAAVEKLFEVEGQTLAAEVTLEDIESAAALVEDLDESAEKDALQTLVNQAYLLLAGAAVASLFEGDDLAEGVTRDDIEAVRDMLDSLPEDLDLLAIRDMLNQAYVLIAIVEAAEGAVKALFDGDDLAEGVTLENIDDAKDLVEGISPYHQAALLAEVERAYFLYATAEIDALFDGDALAEGVDIDAIESVEFMIVDLLIGEDEMEELMERIELAKEILAATDEATNAVAALFADHEKEALADGINILNIHSAKGKVEALPEGKVKDDLMADINKAFYLFAEITVDALFNDAGELIEPEPDSIIKDDIDYAKGLVESLDDEYAVEKADLLGKIDEAYLQYAARVLAGFFTDDDSKEFLNDDVTKEDIDEIYELLESLPESDERDTLMADARTAYAILARVVVDDLFEEDDDGEFILKENTKKADIDDAKLLILMMPDGEEKTSLMTELNNAYFQLAAIEVPALFDPHDNDMLAEGVKKEQIDAAKELVEELSEDQEKDDLMAEIDRAYLINATSAVEALFSGDWIADDLKKADIDAAQALVDELSVDENDLQDDIDLAYGIFSAIEAVDDLFDFDGAALADGVVEGDIDAAEALVLALPETLNSTEISLLLGQIDAARGLLPADDIKYGDVDNDGSITVTDAILILRHIVGLTVLTEHPVYGANVMARAKVSLGGGTLNVSDAILILRHIVGLQPVFPVENPA